MAPTIEWRFYSKIISTYWHGRKTRRFDNVLLHKQHIVSYLGWSVKIDGTAVGFSAFLWRWVFRYVSSRKSSCVKCSSQTPSWSGFQPVPTTLLTAHSHASRTCSLSCLGNANTETFVRVFPASCFRSVLVGEYPERQPTIAHFTIMMASKSPVQREHIYAETFQFTACNCKT